LIGERKTGEKITKEELDKLQKGAEKGPFSYLFL
jgi:hypothetical protein